MAASAHLNLKDIAFHSGLKQQKSEFYIFVIQADCPEDTNKQIED